MNLVLKRNRLYLKSILYLGSDNEFTGIKYIDMMVMLNHEFDEAEGERLDYFFNDMSLEYYGIPVPMNNTKDTKRVLALGRKHFEEIF